MIIKLPYTIEKRKDISFLLSSLSIVVALTVSILAAAGMISLYGEDVGIVLKAIAGGSFGSMSAIIDTLISEHQTDQLATLEN